jgi:hypothetical protein
MLLAMSENLRVTIEAHSRSFLQLRLHPLHNTHAGPRQFGCGIGIDVLLETALGPILAVVVVLELVSRVAVGVLGVFASAEGAVRKLG